MINPSFRELEEISKSRYRIAMMAAKRAKQIIDGDKPMIKGKGVKPVTIAINEIMAGKIEREED
ncbi:MAG: DNA-directed RNA polymerase subunit omega [Tissierellia bacterium]|nr:DNA-directed RNA polymerase subunit omega [Tissierellia bacterium]